jgi:hypothetical protein
MGYVENKKCHFCHSCPDFDRDKLQQESNSLFYCSLFLQGQVWIPACAGMTPLFSLFVGGQLAMTNLLGINLFLPDVRS